MGAEAAGAQLPSCPPLGSTSWSAQFGSLSDGDVAEIPAGMTVYLDVSTPKLNALLVEGNLVFDH